MKRFIAILFCVALIAASFVANANAANSHATLYVTGGSTAQALSTTAAKMTGFAAVGESSEDQGDQLVTATLASDIISVKAGHTYLVKFACTATMGTADIQTAFTLRAGTTAITGATCGLEVEEAAALSSTSMVWVYRPTADADLSIYVASESSTPNFTPVDATLTVISLD